MSDGNVNLFDRDDLAAPEVGLSMKLVDVQLHQAPYLQAARKLGDGVVRLDPNLVDVPVILLIGRGPLQLPLQRFGPGAGRIQLEVYDADPIRNDFDGQIGIGRACKA